MHLEISEGVLGDLDRSVVESGDSGRIWRFWGKSVIFGKTWVFGQIWQIWGSGTDLGPDPARISGFRGIRGFRGIWDSGGFPAQIWVSGPDLGFRARSGSDLGLRPDFPGGIQAWETRPRGGLGPDLADLGQIWARSGSGPDLADLGGIPGPGICNPCHGFPGFSGCRGPFNKCIFRSGFGVFFGAARGVAKTGPGVCFRSESGIPGNLEDSGESGIPGQIWQIWGFLVNPG